MRQLSVTLDAVIVAVTDETPRMLLVDHDDPPSRSSGRASRVPSGLPSGPLDAERDETLTLGLRRLVASQTGVDVTYVEQLYTFGDADRVGASTTRDLAIGYVALTKEETTTPGSRWTDVYELFPWEDHRTDSPRVMIGHIEDGLGRWAGKSSERIARRNITFGSDTPWDPIRVLERYELLFEAGLVGEAGGSPDLGTTLRDDHRRVAATALGRLRGKLTYRPVIFEVMPDIFTLTNLQTTVEAIVGIRLHKQNFRRIVEREALVEPTGRSTTATGGRPAELFRFRSDVVAEKPRPGFPLPRPRQM